MANPQPDEYTRLSNELLEAIMKSQFSKRQLNILFLIWRCSYGFGKKVARLKKSDFQAVGVYPGDIKKELNYLNETKVIIWDEKDDLVAFNKDYDRWRISLSRSAVNGKIDFSEILKKQFDKLSETLNSDISKILNLPVDNSDVVNETLKNDEDNFSEILNVQKEGVSKTLTKLGQKVSKTLTSDSSELSSDGIHKERKEIIKEIKNKEDDHHDLGIIPITYEKVFSRMISSFQLELLRAYVEDDEMAPAVVVRAIQIAGENGAGSIKYVTSVLDDWRGKRVKTLEDAEKAIREYELSRASPNKNRASPEEQKLIELVKDKLNYEIAPEKARKLLYYTSFDVIKKKIDELKKKPPNGKQAFYWLKSAIEKTHGLHKGYR